MKILPRKTQRGFTLIELMITLALIGLILGLVVGGSGGYSEDDMKHAANKLAATSRYLYNKAATDRIYIKLILDFEEQSYWVEASGDPFFLSSPDQFTAEQEKIATQEDEVEEPLEEGEIKRLKPKKASFTQVAEYLLRASKLPEGVFFKDLHVEHLPGIVESGKASILFFPNGYVEDAIINLRDSDDTVNYSLKTNPISGKMNIDSIYRSLENE